MDALRFPFGPRSPATAATGGVGEHAGHLTPLVTGLNDVDRITRGGFGPGIHLISGVPGVGKTSFLITLLARAIANDDGAHLVVSGAVDQDAVERRLLTAVGHRAGTGDVTALTIDGGTAATDPDRRWRIGSLGTDPLELWAVGAALIELEHRTERPPTALFIDDFDVLTASGPRAVDHHVAMAVTAAGLNDLARRLAIPVILTTALPSAYPSHPGWRPGTHDVRGWAALQPHARSTWLLYRDEMYDDESADRGVGEAILVSHAHGHLGTLRLAFLPHVGLWANLARP